MILVPPFPCIRRIVGLDQRGVKFKFGRLDKPAAPATGRSEIPPVVRHLPAHRKPPWRSRRKSCPHRPIRPGYTRSVALFRRFTKFSADTLKLASIVLSRAADFCQEPDGAKQVKSPRIWLTSNAIHSDIGHPRWGVDLRPASLPTANPHQPSKPMTAYLRALCGHHGWMH